MTTESRYQRSKQLQEAKARHARIVATLSRGIVEEYAEALETEQTNCGRRGTPSEWIDWDSVPEYREPYEGDMPTAERAREMCNDCPLMGDRLCERYAEATSQGHGIWGGRRRENGKWVKA
jgi:hypothetical protein